MIFSRLPNSKAVSSKFNLKVNLENQIAKEWRNIGKELFFVAKNSYLFVRPQLLSIEASRGHCESMCLGNNVDDYVGFGAELLTANWGVTS